MVDITQWLGNLANKATEVGRQVSLTSPKIGCKLGRLWAKTL
jgi:hypothetical protein